MRGFGVQRAQIQRLIDKMQHHMAYPVPVNPQECQQLLSLSEQLNFSYGKALAHFHLARYNFSSLGDSTFQTHLNRAREIADQQNYFDVLVKCFQLEGLFNREICSETAALSSFLEGLALAEKIKDWRACAIFYNSIAEVFFARGAYGDAEEFNCKALEVLESRPAAEAALGRKSVLLRLLHLACAQGDPDKAADYYRRCREISCHQGNLPLLLLQGELRLLLLQNQDAAPHTARLLQSLRQSTLGPALLQPVYLECMELLLSMKLEEEAAWCLERIDALYPAVSPKTALHIQKLRIQYTEAFGLADDSVYMGFYAIVQQRGEANRAATADSFHSMRDLSQTAREHSRMLADRAGLQTAVDLDEMTQIYNNRYYRKLMSKLLQDERLASLGCVMVDVDFFKEYNDHYGHLAGDRVLQTIARVLSAHLPPEASVARYGGDEFSCLFIDLPPQEIIAFIQRAREALRAEAIPHQANPATGLVTLSFGVCHQPHPQDCSETQILSRADEALYLAKRKGRDTYAVWGQEESPG